jgi:phosphoribosylformimino-5-aminoimidazole carboxamide ribotide isomerase
VLIIPAIDLLHGQCVRLKKGVESTAKVYESDPAAAARRWQEEGARLIHVVNLDGAFGRSRENVKAIEQIISAIDIPIELGGGIRTVADAEKWLSIGVSRVIIGSVAVTDPTIVKQAIEAFGAEKVVIGIDARQDKVAIHGWEHQTEKNLFALAKEMNEMGVRRLIYTDVHRDGLQQGPNIEATVALAKATPAKVIASGGFSELTHFQGLAETKTENIEGAIVGTALYEGKLDLSELNKMFDQMMGSLNRQM